MGLMVQSSMGPTLNPLVSSVPVSTEGIAAELIKEATMIVSLYGHLGSEI